MPPRTAAGIPPVAIDILVEAGAWPPKKSLAPLVDRAIAAALLVTRARLAAGAEVSVVFTDDAHVRKLNHRYRDKDGPTNVLSFPSAQLEPGRFGPPLGDIVLGYDTVAKEAENGNLALPAHVTHLLVHGFLHLLGYDHNADDEAAAMEGLETAILSTLGIADPYAGEAGGIEPTRS